jgi:hypothetical protein
MGERQKLIYVSTPSSLALLLSTGTTIAEQEQARLRKSRSDIGKARAPYNTKRRQKKKETNY